jgi:hypothetical protein
MTNENADAMTATCDAIIAYLVRCQDFSPGQYYGAFWSEKAYHGPLLDWHAGGSHHPRGAGSGGLGLWLAGKERGEEELLRRADAAFDWVVTRQHSSGGYFEIQNNEQPSDWEFTGLEECSTIETGFVSHGLAQAVLAGLPPKAAYEQCLQRAGHWFLSLEWPAGSGIFPHHDRSPYDTLNANMHTADSLAAIFTALREVYGRTLNIFYQGARRAIWHTLGEQWPDGCFPYRANNGITINYTSLVVWCLLNVLETLPAAHYREDVAPAEQVREALEQAGRFLSGCVASDGTLLWEGNETSTARHNMWTYALTANVLRRIGGAANAAAAARLLGYALGRRTASGLLPMRDEGEEITECAYMQADMLLFLRGGA